ncbi:MAG: response regulator [Chthoniobacterales bacterium]
MAAASLTNIVVIDGHVFMRELISRKLHGHDNGRFQVAAEGGDVRSAVDACEKLQPHLIILDVNLPDGSGISAVTEIKQKCPGSRVLLCTAYVSEERVIDALRSGADRFVEKTNSWAEFVEAVERVSRGERYFSTQSVADTPATARALRHDVAIAKVATLSAREREVLQHIATGSSSKAIALALGVSVGTINVHRSNLMKKLGTTNIAAVVAFAFHAGLITAFALTHRGRAIESSRMSVAEIVKEVPKLSLAEMKEVARALREAMEDSEDLADVLAVLENPGTPVPMAEIQKKYGV